MKINILSISDSDKHFSSAIQEYTKRLGKTIELKDLKPTKNGSREQIIEKDTDNIINILEKNFSDYKKILLSRDGKNIDTIEFKKIIINNTSNSKIIFIIGGPYGLNEEKINKYINEKISFGKMTFPHGLAKLILLEQIYRIQSIESGKSYHY